MTQDGDNIYCFNPVITRYNQPEPVRLPHDIHVTTLNTESFTDYINVTVIPVIVGLHRIHKFKLFIQNWIKMSNLFIKRL